VAGKTYEYRNDPDSRIACETAGDRPRCFSDMVDIAIASGLTVQIQTQKATGAGKAEVLGRLCFDPVLVERARRDYPAEIFEQLATTSRHRPSCSDPWPKASDTGGTDTLTFAVLGTPLGPMRYEITTRSTYGIYQFLGRILATGMGDQIRLRGHREQDEDPRLLTVVDGQQNGCFVDLKFDGYYCVPRQGAENTKRIFSLLAQLLALKTQPGDLAITPTVRTIP
jgi:hypothetical protein